MIESSGFRWTCVPNRPVRRLRQFHVRAGVVYEGFIPTRVARVGQDLIDAPAGHDVAAEKQAQVLVHTGRIRPAAGYAGPCRELEPGD